MPAELDADSVGGSGWAVDYSSFLTIAVKNTMTTITRINAVVSAGGENCDLISVFPGVKQQDGNTVSVTGLNCRMCQFKGDNTDPVEFSQITVYYHTHNYQPLYICRDCGAETNVPPDGAGSTLSEGNLTIVCSVACLALGLVGGIVIGRKKKTSEA